MILDMVLKYMDKDMKLVREHINEFNRGKDPEQKLGLGNYRPFEVGDKVICLEDIKPVGKCERRCCGCRVDIFDTIAK